MQMCPGQTIVTEQIPTKDLNMASKKEFNYIKWKKKNKNTALRRKQYTNEKRKSKRREKMA